jgi:uroporphyrinogen decarboxylase
VNPNNEISGKDRVLRTLSFRETDRVAVIPVTHSCSPKQVGYTLGEAMRDPRKYVESQVKCLEKFGYDGVWGLSVTEMAEVLGCEIVVHADDVPAVGKGSLADVKDLSRLPEPDFENSIWLERKREVISSLKREVGEQAVIIAPAITPLRAAAMTRGPMNFLLDLVETPEFVRDLMEVCTEHCLTAAKMLGHSGADFLFFPLPLASRNLISRSQFAEFVNPYIKRIVGGMKKTGFRTLVHTCGDWNDRFDLVADLQADMVQVTSDTHLASLRNQLDKSITFMGKVKSLQTMLQGTPDDVKAESTENILSVGEAGGFVLSADCALPRDTPEANIHAMVDAARECRI